jgi:sugar O-acyltransferase (sialic acid O-acetyltransferase NeuD family)
MRILLIGAGGHGQVVADILRSKPDAGHVVVGFLDDDPVARERAGSGDAVLGRVEARGKIPHDAVIVCVGDNSARARIFQALAAEGARFATAVHRASVLAPDVAIGAGTVICAGVVVNVGTRIGRNAIVNTSCSIDHHCAIGDHVHIAPGVHLGGNVTIGEGALIGIGATVLPGVKVGAHAVVGAGSVVLRDLPSGVTVVGNPATAIEKRRTDGVR